MKLVVDSNRIMAALIKNSTSREILLDEKYDFVGVSFSQYEIRKHQKLILKKAEISEKQYQVTFNLVFSKIKLFDENEVQLKFLEKAFAIMKEIDETDTPFLALALQEKCVIWSDDKHFLKQNKVKVWSTRKLAKKM